MHIQSIANQPKFNGKIVFEPHTTTSLTRYVPEPLWRKFKNVATMICEKPYDIFVWQNKQDKKFYNIAANTSMEDAQKVCSYTVKIQSNVIAESVENAAKDAMDMYEKYIAKGVKR